MNSLLTKIIRRLARLLARQVDHDVLPAKRLPRIEDLIHQAFHQHSNVRFIQIGAHDGTHNDPISHFRDQPNWSGLLLEPNPPVYQRLKQNLASAPRHKPINVALASESGSLPFYIIGNPEKCKEPFWADQVSSFDRAHVEKMLLRFGHQPNEIPEIIQEIQVQSKSFHDLLDEMKEPLNFLFIDAEGADFSLLKHFPFDRQKPEVIVFEAAHLTQDELAELPHFFHCNGYAYMPVAEDIFALKWQ
jgi:FkbM family methyltransferase